MGFVWLAGLFEREGMARNVRLLTMCIVACRCGCSVLSRFL